MNHGVVDISGVKVGEGQPVRIAAEIGTYFGQDIVQAKEYVRVAKESGVEFLKTEILHDLSILWDADMMHTYKTDGGPVTENYRNLLARKLVGLKDYEKLISYAHDNGLPVIASVYDFKGVDFMAASGGAAVKVASQNITNRPLIEHCARSGLPFIMDTGNALIEEVAAAVRWAEGSGVNGIILNHRPDGSPCPANEHNMKLLESYADKFGWPVGLSCHYDGDEMIYLAIGMGASLIEKPLYHKKFRDDQDTMFVLHYDAFNDMVHKVRNCSDARGDGARHKHISNQLENRACVVAAKDIKRGQTINSGDVLFAWPMRGVPAEYWHKISGSVVARDIKINEPIKWDDVEVVNA